MKTIRTIGDLRTEPRDGSVGLVAWLGAQVADRSDGLHTRVASASTS